LHTITPILGLITKNVGRRQSLLTLKLEVQNTARTGIFIAYKKGNLGMDFQNLKGENSI
jgi:hypothetical protein